MSRNRAGVLIAALLFVVCQGLLASPFSDLVPGEYSYFVDRRSGSDYYRGYMYGGNRDGVELFFVRSVDLGGSSEAVFQVSIVVDEDGTLVHRGDETIGGSRTREHYQAVVDLMNHCEMYRTAAIVEVSAVRDDPWPELGYTLHYQFSSFFPLLRLRSISRGDEPVPSYFIDRGDVHSDEQSVRSFFTVLPQRLPERAIPTSAARLLARQPQTVQLNDFELPLDEHWQRRDGAYPGYWLIVETERDSQIGVEKAAWSWVRSLGTSDLVGFVGRILANTRQFMVLSTLQAEEEHGEILVQYLSVGEREQTTYTRLRFVRHDESVYIVNFSSFKSIFDNNRDYYEHMLAGIRPAW